MAVQASPPDKPLVWLSGELKTPPLSPGARIEAGVLLRRLQRGETVGMPHSRPMPGIGTRCHELRVNDERASWRIVYRFEAEAILILAVFRKTTQATPAGLIQTCRRRLRLYEAASRGKRPDQAV